MNAGLARHPRLGGWLLVWVTPLLACAGGCITISPVVQEEVQAVVLQPSGTFWPAPRVAVVDLAGEIASGPRRGPIHWGETTPADVQEVLSKVADDASVRAVVLNINSPGGEVTASDIIHQHIRRFRKEKGIPVVASFQELGASGAYYVACACDCIVACPTTVTGSVGVVLYTFNVEGLLGKVGVQTLAIKSGAQKDLASPLRSMSAEERDILQGVINEMFGRFVEVVRAGRPRMTEQSVNALQDGRIVTAGAALSMGMVDRVGYLEDAVEEAKALARIEKAEVVAFRKNYNVNLLAARGGEAPSAQVASAVLEGLRALSLPRAPGFYYLWAPGL